jgi:hypothetical protein
MARERHSIFLEPKINAEDRRRESLAIDAGVMRKAK